MASMSDSGPRHWDTLYGAKAANEVSWFQAWPETSLRLLSSVASPAGALIDVGGLAQFNPFGHFGLLVDAPRRLMLGRLQVGCGTAFRMKELAG